MKCQLKISKWCEKTMSKKNTKIIEGKECCAICYWKQKQINKEKRQELPIKPKKKKAEVPKSKAFKLLDCKGKKEGKVYKV